MDRATERTAASEALRVRVKGRVQGVWFRAWTINEATRRGLRGWVRNRRDGSVEALFSGPSRQVDGMVEACRRGPTAAQVDDVEIEPAEDPVEDGFRQLPTT